VPPDNYAIEAVISGLLRMLVKSSVVKVSVLEEEVLGPLLHHIQVHESYSRKADSEKERARHNEISIECMTWHAHLENVLNGLK
jgi:hypothetical protein